VEWVEAVHPAAHVERIRSLCEAGGGMIDLDTVASPGSYEAALHGAGAVCSLAASVLEGSASTGFCAMRPPGHHAETATAMGFCLFNSVAVGARYAIDRLDAERVLVLDWDVHHGNGTNEVFHASADILFASIHQSPLYPGSGPLSDVGEDAGRGYSHNLPVPPGSGRETFLGLVQHVIAPAARSFRPGLILISAGYDAHRVDPLASCSLESEHYRELAAAVRALGDELGAPVGATLEGGYELDALAESVACTLEGLTDAEPPAEVEPDPVVSRAVEALSQYW
jgi:acetoin utilization deacetylase AcuC-like enzyme